LRHVTDEMPGITRKLAGKRFVFFHPGGKRITDKHEIERIRALAVPPAYTHVWICPISNGHLQATGRDARGRKQYRYHRRWREVRDENKFGRMIAFGKTLPKIRKAVHRDLKLPRLPREKVLAAVVQLLETTLIRVGNEEYAKANRSYGLTTLKNQHVEVKGSTLRFKFKGKSGIKHAIDLHDTRLAKIVRECRDIPGQELFQFEDDDGNHQAVTSQDVNDYIRAISGDDFTAKDFRTWVGTVACAMLLCSYPPFENAMQAKSNVVDAIKQVSERLGNTPSVCRKCYVHPSVIERYMDEGALSEMPQAVAESLKKPATVLLSEERAVLRLLQKSAKEAGPGRTAKLLRKSLPRAKRKAA